MADVLLSIWYVYERSVGFNVVSQIIAFDFLAVPCNVLTFGEPQGRRRDIVYVAVLEVDSFGIAEVHSSAGAFIDLGIYDVNAVTHKSIDAHVSASVKAHLFNLDRLTVIEIKNAAGACTFFLLYGLP